MKNLFVLLTTIVMTAGLAAQGRPQGNHHHHQRPPRERYIECASQEQIDMTMRVLKQQAFDDKPWDISAWMTWHEWRRSFPLTKTD